MCVFVHLEGGGKVRSTGGRLSCLKNDVCRCQRAILRQSSVPGVPRERQPKFNKHRWNMMAIAAACWRNVLIVRSNVLFGLGEAPDQIEMKRSSHEDIDPSGKTGSCCKRQLALGL